MAKLVFETALKIDPESGKLISYWPDRWPLSALLQQWRTIGTPFFAAGYQNDPSALEGNCLKADWLHFYHPTELDTLRSNNGGRGWIKIGIDTTQGGSGADPDYLTLCAVEIIKGKGYLIGFHASRVTVKEQASIIKSWCDLYRPDLITLEDISAKGYVYTDLTEGNDPIKYPIVVRVPRGVDKQTRFLSMAARFENGQVLVPGVVTPILGSSELAIDPAWDSFLLQWRSFPSGHDDILDAVYWALDEAFQTTEAIGVSISPQQREEQFRDQERIRKEEALRLSTQGQENNPIDRRIWDDPEPLSRRIGYSNTDRPRLRMFR